MYIAAGGALLMWRGSATRFLRGLRRTKYGGAIEYLAQYIDGRFHRELLRSGATSEEQRRALPGDGLVARPMWEATRAVTIAGSPSEVWPWVAQMGFGRGGWYGWNPLERADTGVSKLLDDTPSRVGDVWLDGPGCNETKGAWKVETLDAPRAVVLHSMRHPVTGRELDPTHRPWLFIDTAWAFHLDQVDPGSTRLLARTRIRLKPRWALLALKWMGHGDTVMQRRLLDGIKMRVEAAGKRGLAGAQA